MHLAPSRRQTTKSDRVISSHSAHIRPVLSQGHLPDLARQYLKHRLELLLCAEPVGLFSGRVLLGAEVLESERLDDEERRVVFERAGVVAGERELGVGGAVRRAEEVPVDLALFEVDGFEVLGVVVGFGWVGESEGLDDGDGDLEEAGFFGVVDVVGADLGEVAVAFVELVGADSHVDVLGAVDHVDVRRAFEPLVGVVVGVDYERDLAVERELVFLAWSMFV